MPPTSASRKINFSLLSCFHLLRIKTEDDSHTFLRFPIHPPQQTIIRKNIKNVKRIFDISSISFLYIQFYIKHFRLLPQLLLQMKPFSTAFLLFLQSACIFFQCFHICFSIPAQCHIFPHDRSDPHIFIHQKRLPDDILTV